MNSYRKDAKKDKNNFSEPDALAMVALTPRYHGNNSKPLIETMRCKETMAVGIGQKTNNNPMNHANLFGSVRYRSITNTNPRIVKKSPMITVINTQPIGRILAASGKSKNGSACKPTKTLNRKGTNNVGAIRTYESCKRNRFKQYKQIPVPIK